jgi:hypothetical protein
MADQDDASLERLLEAARAASRRDRIEYRDGIASFGPRAIAAMREWIRDADLAAFAVRVMESAAALGWVADARSALRDARKQAPTPTIKGDIDRVLASLGPAASRRRAGGDGDFELVEQGTLDDGRRYVTYRIEAQTQGSHFNLPRAVMDDLGIQTDGNVDLHVVARDVDFRGVVAIASGTELYYRLGDQATHGLLRIRPNEMITVTAARPAR